MGEKGKDRALKRRRPFWSFYFRASFPEHPLTPLHGVNIAGGGMVTLEETTLPRPDQFSLRQSIVCPSVSLFSSSSRRPRAPCPFFTSNDCPPFSSSRLPIRKARLTYTIPPGWRLTSCTDTSATRSTRRSSVSSITSASESWRERDEWPPAHTLTILSRTIWEVCFP